MQLLSSTSSSGFATALSANTGSGVDSIIVVVGIAIAIPLAFYVAKRIIGLFPKGK